MTWFPLEATASEHTTEGAAILFSCTLGFSSPFSENKPGKGRQFTAQIGAICANGLSVDASSRSLLFVWNTQVLAGQLLPWHTLPSPATPPPTHCFITSRARTKEHRRKSVLSCNDVQKPGTSNCGKMLQSLLTTCKLLLFQSVVKHSSR